MRSSIYCVFKVILLSLCVVGLSAKKRKNNKEGQPPRWKDGDKFAEDPYQSAYEGRNLKLDCAARGRPKPKVSWFKDGKKIKMNEDIKVKKHSLTFKSLSVNDRGNYTCIVKNEHGRLEFTYNVDVTVQIWPLEVEGPMNLTVLEGETVKFRCRVLNDPKATISWLKRNPDDPSEEGSLDKKPEFLENNGQDQELLVLPNVTKKDSGKYACLAGNLWGIKYSNAWLIVVPVGNSPSIFLESNTRVSRTTTSISTSTTTTSAPTTITTPVAHFYWTKDPVLIEVTNPPFFPFTKMQPATKRPKHRKNGRRRNKDRRKNKHRNKNAETADFTTHPMNRYPVSTKDSGLDRNNHHPSYTSEENSIGNNENKTPIVNEENTAGNKTSQEMHGAGTTIGLWAVYTTVGAIAGIILLVGLIAITVALCCRHDSSSVYKSTPV